MFVPGKVFQPILMFAGKAIPKSCFTWVGSGLNHKYYTKL